MVDHNNTGKSPGSTPGTLGEGLSLSLLQSGDRHEFARMVDTYSNKLYRLTLKMLSNPQDAEDALQETFLKAFRFIGSFDGRSSLSTWLYRIATNEALMQIRRKHPEFISIDESIEMDEGEAEPVQIVDWCCIPERELLTTESRRQMDWAIKQLPPSLRAAFLLRDIEGLSTLEAAEVLGLSETALKTRLSRARLRLRELLSAYFADRITNLQAEE
jgi:RNA polymerase sigma-70 factor (ECF subfamily)